MTVTGDSSGAASWFPGPGSSMAAELAGGTARWKSCKGVFRWKAEGRSVGTEIQTGILVRRRWPLSRGRAAGK